MIKVARASYLLRMRKSWLKEENGDTIVIPSVTVSMLYNFNGAKIREATDYVSWLKSLPYDKLVDGGAMFNGTKFRVMHSEGSMSPKFLTFKDLNDYDREIFQICINLMEKNPEQEVVLFSQNPSVLISGAALGIKVSNVEDVLYPRPEKQYSGIAIRQISQSSWEEFHKNGKLSVPSMDLFENEFVILNGAISGQEYAKYSHGVLFKLYNLVSHDYKPMNAEQRFLEEALMSPADKFPFVICKGSAGTGKTHAATIIAMELLRGFSSNTNYPSTYDKIIILTSAPDYSKFGFIPGDLYSKLGPTFGGINDNLFNMYMDNYSKETCGRENDIKAASSAVEELFLSQKIIIQPPTKDFLLGHSFKRSFVIIDEAQNITPSDCYGIVSRLDSGSKMVFIGDTDSRQIKNPKLTQTINGLVYMAEAWKGSSKALVVTLKTGVRHGDDLFKEIDERMT